MPEMDGYTVIEELKKDPALHEIPVIVIAAAHLNPSEKARLQGQTRSLFRKGNFVDSDLLADIDAVLG